MDPHLPRSLKFEGPKSILRCLCRIPPLPFVYSLALFPLFGPILVDSALPAWHNLVVQHI
jgi:hypothetical protein